MTEQAGVRCVLRIVCHNVSNIGVKKSNTQSIYTLPEFIINKDCEKLRK